MRARRGIGSERERKVCSSSPLPYLRPRRCPVAPGSTHDAFHECALAVAASAVKESEHRVESAIKTAGYFIPRNKVVVNLAPANIRKEGSAYDLPIALGILSASAQITTDVLEKYVIMGELSLDGELRPIKGVLPIAIQSRKQEFRGFILPKANAREAAIVSPLGGRVADL